MNHNSLLNRVKDFVKTIAFSELTVAGEEEKKERIPDNPPSPKITVMVKTNPVSHSEDRPEWNYTPYALNTKFIKEMYKYAEKTAPEAPFVPFMEYWPTYDRMNRQQREWYFYWRTQVRSGNYLNTDQSYIFVHAYELLSGCGWKSGEEGYDQLRGLWMAYREQFPKLDDYFFSWCFDFTQFHNLEFIQPDDPNLPLPEHPTVRDLLIDMHSEDRPLKLSFTMIQALCDYSMVKSKFYKEGNQLLMQEAIPRVVALADAALLKKKGKGILAVYGPSRTRKQMYYAFQSAVCPLANKQMEVSVKAYTFSQKLRGFINELVRYAENVLRSLYGSRGRLRNIELDAEIAALVDAFLKKEYSPRKEENPPKQKTELKLDFDNIEELRGQSDAVRDALEVAESLAEEEECDVFGTETNVTAGTGEAADGIIEEPEVNMGAGIEEVSQAGTGVDTEAECNHESEFFEFSCLSENMQQLIENLTILQQEALHAILTMEDPQERLEQLAEENMSMPEILIDEINDLATQFLDDILIDAFDDTPSVLEEYVPELNEAVKMEEI